MNMLARRWLPLVLGLSVIPAAFAAASILRDADPVAKPEVREGREPGAHPTNGSPCPNPVEMTLDEARRKATVLMPDHTLANSGSLESIVLCGEQLRLSFTSGVQFLIIKNEITDPRGNFERRAQRDSSGGSLVGEVRGQPALFLDRAKHPGIGSAEWVEGRWFYVLRGNGVASLDDIRAIVRSLREA